MSRLSIVVLLCLYPSFKIVEGQLTAKPICTEEGAFEINDGTCKNYYLCVDDGEKFTPVMLSCSNIAIFDTSMRKCVPEGTAVCQQTTTMAPSTTSAPLCVRYGRFSILDVECKKYYLCYWDGARYIIMDNLSCPNVLVFNPTSEKCVPPQMYTCPGITEGK
ncbi:PREDICTED: uncharacterized protein LOC105558994 [Vollenhovia emeryi]|uniref:uncharacterized protein LOC105558994 n=1 Tax=Vollenhovia emeryi TaxID=411798 RepID=UPI0005F56014|nr:PREDICTED: uncharacterized protein LOC105558994 [Vollenhovia emeryi]